MKKLTDRGFSHLLVPVLAFLLVAGVGGAYLLAKSNAASTTNTGTTATTQTTDTASTPASEPASTGTDAADTDTAALTANLNSLLQKVSSSSKPRLCLYWDKSQCIVTHGGNQATISGDSGSWASWKAYAVGSGIEFENGAGNCLHTNSLGIVSMENSHCSGNLDERWRVTMSNPYIHLRSVKYSAQKWYLGTYGNSNGKPVWALPKGDPNSWISWDIINK